MDEPLTQQESIVVEMAFRGWRIRDIAISLGVTRGQIRTVFWRIFRKLGVRSQLELITKAHREGGFNLWAYPSAE